MNEQRIRELEDQCWVKVPCDFDMYAGGSSTIRTVFDRKKFAELIVAKCIEEAGDPADGLIKGNTWHDGVRTSVWSIKQYFGVEE